MTDPNLPAGADRPDAPFNQEQPRMRVCPNCSGSGSIEMTPEEIRDEIEAKKEQRHTHQL